MEVVGKEVLVIGLKACPNVGRGVTIIGQTKGQRTCEAGKMNSEEVGEDGKLTGAIDGYKEVTEVDRNRGFNQMVIGLSPDRGVTSKSIVEVVGKEVFVIGLKASQILGGWDQVVIGLSPNRGIASKSMVEG